MKVWFISMIFLAVMLQLGACSSTQTTEQQKQDDIATAKKRVPFQYHRHFDDK